MSVAATLVLASPAHASTLTLEGGVLTFTAAEGVANTLEIYSGDPDESTFDGVTVESYGDPIDPVPDGCTDHSGDWSEPAGTIIYCAEATSVVASTLDGEDSLTARWLMVPLTADGGADDDFVWGGSADDDLSGGDGDDELYGDRVGAEGDIGEGGNDTLNGGPGDDLVAGGVGNDTVDGGDGSDHAVGGPGDDTVDGGPGDDVFDYAKEQGGVAGGPGNDTVRGGEGNDEVIGDCAFACGAAPSATHRTSWRSFDGADSRMAPRPDGEDTVEGGPGDDVVAGSGGTDTVRGGDGDDLVLGDCPFGCYDEATQPEGDDTLEGGPGADQLHGGGGNDNENGGPGSDRFGSAITGPYPLPPVDPGDDVFIGGDGIDAIGYPTVYYGSGPPMKSDSEAAAIERLDVRVSLDDVANDGHFDENDNVMSDIEDVRIDGSGPMNGPGPGPIPFRSSDGAAAEETNTGRADLIGDGDLNSLTGADGDDFIDGKEGNDFLTGMSGDDTFEARDGFADRILCGPGNDTAMVDTLDIVSDCENVTVEDVGNANDVPEDNPPAVAWTAPAPGTEIGAEGTAFAASAADDNGVTQVVFFAGNRLVCVDTTAPYGCQFSPLGVDVGRLALVAIAIDTAGQLATAIQEVAVDRFRPTRLTADTSPKKDTKGPRRFTTKGELILPDGVSVEQGCTGRVSVQIKAGKRTISTRRAKLKDDCSYRSKVKLTVPRRFGSAKRLKIRARYLGNKTLKRKKAAREKVRVR